MSKIYHSGSQVRFETVRFDDMESVARNGSFFVPVNPAQNIDAGPEPGQESGSEEADLTASPVDAPPPVDVEAIREAAFAEGVQASRKEMEDKLHKSAQSLAKALEEINRLRESLLLKSREDMVRLVMAVAGRVIHVEVDEKKEIIEKAVVHALKSAVQSDEYYIRINPGDLDRVKENEPLFLAAMKGLKKVHFMADESVSRGGCIVESQTGDVDATIESQMEEIDRYLRGEIL